MRDRLCEEHEGEAASTGTTQQLHSTQQAHTTHRCLKYTSI